MSLLAKKMAFMSAVNAGPPTVTLDATIDCYEIAGGNVELAVEGNGNLERTLLTETSLSNNWVADGDKGGNYGSLFEVRLSKTAGTDPSTNPGLGTWLTINTERRWIWGPTDSFDGTLEVREIANPGTNIDSATIDVRDNP